MRYDPMQAWAVERTAWPRGGSVEEKLWFLVRYAILAPSGHNTQPWLFRVRAGRLEVIATGYGRCRWSIRTTGRW